MVKQIHNDTCATRRDTPIGIIALILLTITSAFGQSQRIYRTLYEGVDISRIRDTVAYMSSLHSRVVGYPGERRAAEWVRQRFLELGLDNVTEQRFKVTVPIDRGAALELPELGKSYKLYPIWPNLVRTSQLPPGGVMGQLIYAHSGKMREFNGKDVRDSIVLLDFVTGSEWFNAPFLGARAVIFIEPEPQDMARWEAELKFLTTPIDIPRFWMPRKDALELLSTLRRNGVEPLTAHLE
ncbi:MAG TPA: hypothetical protein EYP10_10865 [Armatimonadetes bacterium]|nr:hypothetical protein [Armatimonadota bacterium]